MNLVNGGEVAITCSQGFGCCRQALVSERFCRVFLCGLQFLATESASEPLAVAIGLLTAKDSFKLNSTRSLPLPVLYPMPQGQPQKILKQNSAVTRFVRMFPAGAAFVPIFERLFEMKLNGVD